MPALIWYDKEVFFMLFEKKGGHYKENKSLSKGHEHKNIFAYKIITEF